MIIQNWADVLARSLQDLWLQFIGFIPSLVGALIVLIVGLIVATAIGSLVERVLSFLKIDALLAKLGVEAYFERAGLRLNVGRFFGLLVYWFLVVAFLLAASDILGLSALSAFLQDVLRYLPSLAVAVLIMLAAVVIASFLRDLVKASVMSTKLHAPKFLGALVWWAVVVVGFLTALDKLGVPTALLNTFITGVVALIAIAGGIAFGLGGKEYAAHLIEKFREQTETRR